MEEQCRSFDGTILAQKALSAIKRSDEQIDIFMTVDILRGNITKPVKAHKYDELKTFGVGRDVAILDWIDYLEQMLSLGYLKQQEDDRTLKITEAGLNVLLGKAKAELNPPTWNEIVPIDEPIPEPTEPPQTDDDLYKKLKGYACVMAKRRNVPPFKVLQDSTIRSLVAEKPAAVCALTNIQGIGKRKSQQFGVGLVKIIRKHLGMSTEESEEWTSLEVLVK